MKPNVRVSVHLGDGAVLMRAGVVKDTGIPVVTFRQSTKKMKIGTLDEKVDIPTGGPFVAIEIASIDSLNALRSILDDVEEKLKDG